MHVGMYASLYFGVRVCVCMCVCAVCVYINNSRRRQKASSRNAQLCVFQGLFPRVMSQSFTELL